MHDEDLKNFTGLANNTGNCFGRDDLQSAKYSLETRVVLSVLTALFCLFAFIGNVTVIVAILRDRVISKHKQHLYLLSLAVADALLVVLVVPFSLTNELLGYWPFGDVYCRIYMSLDILFCTASICNICCIGIDRFVSVTYPTKYKRLRRIPRIRGAIIFVWIYAAAVSLMPFTTETKIVQGVKHGCFVNDSSWFIILSSFLSFYLPAFIIGPIYVKIFLIGKRLAAAKKARLTKREFYVEANRDGNPIKPPKLQVNGNTVLAESNDGLCNAKNDKSCSYCERRHSTGLTSSSYPTSHLLNAKIDNIKGNEPLHNYCNCYRRCKFQSNKTSFPWRYQQQPGVAVEGIPISPAELCEHASKLTKKTNIECHNLGDTQSSSGENQQKFQLYVRETLHTHSKEDQIQKRYGFFDIFRKCCKRSTWYGVKTQQQTTSLAPLRCNCYVDDVAKRKFLSEPRFLSATKRKNSALKRRASMMSSIRLLGASRREKRFIFIIFVVTGFFMLCWTPFFTTYVVYAVCGENCCIDQNLFKIFFWIGYLNSGINPVLYTIFNKDFRQAFRRLFTLQTHL